MSYCKSNFLLLLLAVLLIGMTGCQRTFVSATPETEATPKPRTLAKKFKNSAPVIHVLVALCDNESQDIVPVSASLGDGDNPKTNLYWGAAYGVKTYFSRSKLWKRISVPASDREEILERVAFEHIKTGAILIADAYQGNKIKTSISDFLAATAGIERENVQTGGKSVQIGDSSNVLVFIGHNGLMDFKMPKPETVSKNSKRDLIVLACLSKKYFEPLIEKSDSNPLLWTSNLMAPEAYILHDALEGKLIGESDEAVRTRAAKAYAKYQRISLRAAKGLLVTG